MTFEEELLIDVSELDERCTYLQEKVAAIEQAVVDWHNEVHPGTIRFCSEKPCRSVVFAGEDCD